MTISYHPASDPLGQSAPLGDALSVPLLGVPVTYRSNSPHVIAVAARVFALWRDLPANLVEAGRPLTVTVIVHPLGAGDPPAAAGERFVVRAHGTSFLAANGPNLLSAQIDSGVATAFVTPELTADEPNLRHNVLEGLGVLLVSYHDRTPVQAAAVVRNGRAVLLIGRGGIGKSTLCYACVRAGFGLLSDETVSVSLARGLRLWGHPGSIQLLPDAPRFFPELANLTPRVQRNGQLKLTVDVASLGPERLATHAERAIICFVERGPGQASRLAPLDAEEAVIALSNPGEPGFGLVYERTPAVARALGAQGAYRLTIGADPGAAAALLAHLTER